MRGLTVRARTLTTLLLLGVLACLSASDGAGIGISSSAPTPQQAAHALYGSLPLAFTPNDGQTDPAIRFLAHGSSFSLALMDDAIAIALDGAMPVREVATSAPAATTLRFTFAGATPAAPLRAAVPLPGVVNYFIGNDPSQWHTNLPTSAQVRYRNLYPGIDLSVYGTEGGQWEYDVIVAPGADPTAFALAISGGSGMTRDEPTGDLIIPMGSGEVRQHAPVLYQEIAGARQPVVGGYEVRGDGTVGFRVGTYDRTMPMVIDPALVYSTYLGGNGSDQGRGIAVDTAGNTYVVGYTNGNFPTTPGADQIAFGGGSNDVFVSKLNATGTALVYSTYLGGNQEDQGYGIAVDSTGNAYVTGYTNGNFPTTPGAFQTALGNNVGGSNAFVTKLNPTGTALVYSTYLGKQGDVGVGITVDSSDNAYVTGYATGAFTTTPGAYQTFFGGISDAFVTKLNPAGTALIYSTYLGGNQSDGGDGIAVDAARNVYVIGTTTGNFPTTPGAYRTTYGGGGDTFVTKLSLPGPNPPLDLLPLPKNPGVSQSAPISPLPNPTRPMGPTQSGAANPLPIRRP